MAKLKSMSDIINDINKTIKSDVGTIATLQDSIDSTSIYQYSTGIMSFDRYLGCGGLLGGRIMNAWGWEQSGKTMTALTVAASIQKQGGQCCFIDAEGTFSPSMAEAVGVDVGKMAIFRSTPEKILTGEDYINIINILVQNGVEFIVVDSVPALIPSSRLTAQVGQGQKATHAQMMSEGLQQVTTFLNGSRKSVVWFINQVRMKPMVMFGRPDESTGGAALKFYSTYSLEMSRKTKNGDITRMIKTQNGTFEERRIGVTVGAKLHKNKTSTIPLDDIEWDIYFSNITDQDGISYSAGVDIYKDMIQNCISVGVVEKKSSWLNWGDIRGNGFDEFSMELRKAGNDALVQMRKEVLLKV